MNVKHYRVGDELGFVSPLPVEKLRHCLLLGIGNVEPDGKLAGIFFIAHSLPVFLREPVQQLKSFDIGPNVLNKQRVAYLA